MDGQVAVLCAAATSCALMGDGHSPYVTGVPS
jgi:hypothetical protein